MKKLLILGAGLEQAIPIRTAQQLGYWVVAVDQDSAAPGLKVADEGIVGDIRSVPFVESCGREHKVSGIFSHGVEIPVVVAEVAERLGLPGLPPDVARVCTSKNLRTAALAQAGVMVPKSMHLLSDDADESVWDYLNMPIVVKPCDNSGSRGVVKVERREDLGAAVTIARGYSKASCLSVEEFIEGPQVSTEAFVNGDQIVIFGLADRNYSDSSDFLPFFVEDGVDMPSNLGAGEINQVGEVVRTAIRSLGINFGAAKGDLIMSKDGPVVLEMACRTSGGWFLAGSVPASTGVDAFKALIPQAAGDPFDLSDLNPKSHEFVSQRYWIPSVGGQLEKVSGIREASQSEGVVQFDSFFPEVGSTIRKSTNHSERFAQVIARGSSRFQATELAKQAISKIEVSIS